MRRAVGYLVVAHVLIVAGALAALPGGLGPAPHALGFAAFVAAFAGVGLAPLHLQLRRSAYTLVLTEAVLVVAFASLGPAAVVAAAVAGELACCLLTRQQASKLLFNVTSTAGAVAFAAFVFTTIASAGFGPAGMWLAPAAAVTAFALATGASVTAVLSIVERRPVRSVVADVAPSTLLSMAASGSLGLCAVRLFEIGWAAPALLLPVVFVSYSSTRRMALHSSEQLRFERLYEASSRTGGLVGFTDALATLAAEARGLVTGSVGVCCAQRGDGPWEGVIVDDRGWRPAAPEAIAALLALGVDRARTIDISQLPRRVRTDVFGGHDLIWAPAPTGTRSRVALAVVRELAPDGEDSGRAEVLAAFAGHAALTVDNAVLYEEVEEALRHQMDLNRQKSDFVAAVSHELRTPLTVMMGAVSTVRRLRERISDEQLTDLVDMASTQGERLKRLIEELLLVASAEHGALHALVAPVDVHAVVRRVADELGHRAGGRIRLQLGGGVEMLHTDEEKLARILVNLVDNAVKYADEGPIDVGVERDGEEVTFSVGDQGPGIPPADRERVFERFVQLDQSSTRRQGGTGLGLALCRELAELLDGSLTLAETRTGARFVLRLPTSPPPSPVPQPDAAAATEGGGPCPFPPTSRPASSSPTTTPISAPSSR